MKKHELTPSGYAQTVVAACLLNGYRDDLQKELDKVLGDRKLRSYVPDGDIRVLRLKKFRIAEPSAYSLGDEELFHWIERIASAPNIGLLDEYKGYIRECAMRMKERGRKLNSLRECLREAVFVMQTLFDKNMPKWRKELES